MVLFCWLIITMATCLWFHHLTCLFISLSISMCHSSSSVHFFSVIFHGIHYNTITAFASDYYDFGAFLSRAYTLDSQMLVYCIFLFILITGMFPSCVWFQVLWYINFWFFSLISFISHFIPSPISFHMNWQSLPYFFLAVSSWCHHEVPAVCILAFPSLAPGVNHFIGSTKCWES